MDLRNFNGIELTLFRPGGSLGIPQRFLSITVRAFEILLWILVNFQKKLLGNQVKFKHFQNFQP